jgi:hypothetical protein
MSDSRICDDKNQSQYSPVYSQTSGHGGSHRGRGITRARGNWRCSGRNDCNNNGKSGAPENGQVIEGGRSGHNKGRYQGGGNLGENPPADGNVDVVGTYTETRFTVKSVDVGKIIGKGGCKIREFEEESGARIKVNDT